MLNLMELVEHRNLLKTIIPKGLESHHVEVVIGKENEAEAFHNYSVVISKYGFPEEAVGTVGVVGPTRMPYAHTISTVGFLSSVLSGLVAGLYGREPPTESTRQDTN
jgi:heat-inducible transcriptional repressor